MYMRDFTKEQTVQLAEKILELLADNPLLMTDGRRNDDSVNLMICCRITGRDYDDWVDEHVDSGYDRLMWKEHRDRIEDYIDNWCPQGEEEKGRNAMIWNSTFQEAKQYVEANM